MSNQGHKYAKVEKLYRLARIKSPSGDIEFIKRAQEIDTILQWVEQLNEVDTENVAPLASVTGHALPMREDVVTDGGIPDKVLGNAPEAASGFFAVPKVVE